jgi:DNA segregation ATPase FtsK/SpoIIIE-like protein
MAVAVLGAPGQSLADWQRHSGQLKSALRVPEVVVTEPRAGVFELALRVRDPLSTPIVLNSLQKAEGWEIPLGVNEYGVPVCGSIRNVSGLVVGGVPGGGKSAWLAFAMASLAHRDDVQWLLIDGKQGYDLEALSPRAYRYISGEAAGDVEAVRDALQDVQTLMRERLRYSRDLYGHPNLWSTSPSRLHPAVVVVIDECQTYLDSKSFSTKESKAVGAEIDSIVRDLVKRGRSAGIVVILSTQRPTADSIPTSTRDNCGLRVCFSVRTREAATAVLGEFSTETSVTPIGAATGVGVSSVAGREVRFRSPFVPEHVIRGHIESTAVLAANPLDLLCGALMDRVSRDGEGCGDTRISHTDSSDTSRPRPAREPLT